MTLKLRAGADILNALEDISATAMAGLIDKRKMTDSARKELQRSALLFPRSAEKTPLGIDVCRMIRRASKPQSIEGIDQ